MVEVIGINNSSFMAEVAQVYSYLQYIILTSTFPQQFHKTNITAVKEEQNMHIKSIPLHVEVMVTCFGTSAAL